MSLGDFWGLGDEIPFNYDKQDGVSVLLVNTEKGKIVFNEVKDKIFFEKRTLEEAIKGNEQLKHPTKKHKNYDLFLKLYSEFGLKKALEETLK